MTVTDMLEQREFSRRNFVKGGALVVTFGIAGGGLVGKAAASSSPIGLTGGAFPLAAHPPLDNWLAIHPDGSVTFSIEKSDIGTHMQTGLLQIAAEELDVPFSQMRLQAGDTSVTPDLGTSSSSAGITGGGPPVRAAAATARLALLNLASAKLGVPTTQLQTSNGVVSVVGNPAQSVSYAQLVGGQRFNVTMTANGTTANSSPVYGTLQTKNPTQYTIVGTSVPGVDVPAKVTGGAVYVTAVTLPGMVHVRPVRPPTNGATLVSVDKSSISHIPSIVDVVVKGNYVAVAAEQEWDAIQAAAELKVKWSNWAGGKALGQPSSGDLYSAMRTVPSINQWSDERGTVTYPAKSVGNAAAALAGAAKVLSASYESPFHIHGPIGPPAVVADVSATQAVAWTASQNIFGMRAIIATLLGLPEANVRLISSSGASAFGDSNTDDCVAEACLVSQMIKRPVRLQYMRADDIMWDSGHSARVTDLQGGLDNTGKVVAWNATTWTADNGGRPYGDAYATQGLAVDYEFPNPASGPSSTAGEGNPGTSLLPVVLMGLGPEFDVEGIASASAATPSSYSFANMNSVLNYLGKGSPRAEPLNGQPQVAPAGSLRIRTSSQSATGGASTTFPIESFMDELAAAAGADPIQFRLPYLTARAVGDLNQLATAAGWDTRPSPGPDAASSAVIARGRGIAVSASSSKVWAEIVEVEVNRKTGKVTVPKVTALLDINLIVNPDSVTQQVEGNTHFGISTTLREERAFSESTMTSRDWITYPILRMLDAPQEIKTILVSNPALPAGSASELNQIQPPAIANAIFDATGVRMRSLPFTPERVRAALKAAGKAL